MNAFEALEKTTLIRKQKTGAFVALIYERIQEAVKQGLYEVTCEADAGVSLRSAASLLKANGYKVERYPNHVTVSWER